MASAEDEAFHRYRLAEQRWHFWADIWGAHHKAGRLGLAAEAQEKCQSFRRQMNAFREWLDAQVRF